MTAPSADDPRPRAGSSELVEWVKRWHEHLQRNAAPGVSPVLRVRRGGALIRGQRARRIHEDLKVLLALAGGGLERMPSDLAGVGARPKVALEVGADGAGLHLAVIYYGRVPGVRALDEARAGLGDAFLRVDGGAGRAIRLELIRAEPPRPMPLVMVEAGGRDFALPMQFISRAVPLEAGVEGSRDHIPAPVQTMAGCLGLTASRSRRGRPTSLIIESAEGGQALCVDAILGHRRTLVYGIGPILGAIPWLLGVTPGEDGEPVPVVNPRRLIAPPQE